jgi:hypothetical protein
MNALKTALSGAYLKRALIVALVVGTILNLINQGDAILLGGHVNVAKLLLTYATPFCVATYAAASALGSQ